MAYLGKVTNLTHRNMIHSIININDLSTLEQNTRKQIYLVFQRVLPAAKCIYLATSFQKFHEIDFLARRQAFSNEQGGPDER